MYLAAFTTCVAFIRQNTESPIGESCYSGGDDPKSSTALLVVFVSLISHEIGLFVITTYRVLSQYRTASGGLLDLMVRHNIVYFAASLALNGVNIIALLLDPEVNKWNSSVIEMGC
ncbi:hypothetical protein K503DRAFT_412797 [Rhizopogon vinicolor AM-OR11-026]|uniref:Uncharacterized protein n=1 Tax=Rhizopogon vinicolor AM-OR11-026 TaxID=1314800 RepID=A0A1B7MQN2_9AGAM|nr:hypothetical protein K503DRAFT_412797 [Rhizopogon vinicolor AM-OR11-026]